MWPRVAACVRVYPLVYALVRVCTPVSACVRVCLCVSERLSSSVTAFVRFFRACPTMSAGVRQRPHVSV